MTCSQREMKIFCRNWKKRQQPPRPTAYRQNRSEPTEGQPRMFRRLKCWILLLIAVEYKQILKINLIRIKDIIVGVAIHEYVFCLPVCKADSMSHFVNCNVCLGTVSQGAGIVYVASNGKAS